MVVQSVHAAKVGDHVGMKVDPDNIHIMIAEDHTNYFAVDINSSHRLEYNGKMLDTSVTKIIKGSKRTADGMLADATRFWNEQVLKGISPDYTDADKDIIKELRTNYISDDVDLEALTKEADELILKISVSQMELEEKIGADVKRLDALKVAIKEKLVSILTESDNHAVYGKWYVTRTPGRRKYDEKALQADGLLDKYSTVGKPIDTLKYKEEK
jgi:hypothetical protein